MTAVLDLLVMLVADIQIVSHLLDRQPVLFAKSLDPLSKFHLIEVHFLSFLRAGAGDSKRCTKGRSRCKMRKQSKRKSTVRIESLEGYGCPAILDSASYGAW